VTSSRRTTRTSRSDLGPASPRGAEPPARRTVLRKLSSRDSRATPTLDQWSRPASSVARDPASPQMHAVFRIDTPGPPARENGGSSVRMNGSSGPRPSVRASSTPCPPPTRSRHREPATATPRGPEAAGFIGETESKRVTNVSLALQTGKRRVAPTCVPAGQSHFSGAACRNRTDDLIITSDSLYRLS